ncbi:MAG: hypothetical protein ACJ0KI_05160 [Dehalococcoidia bacterium]
MVFLLHGQYWYWDEIFYGLLFIGLIASIVLAILGAKGKRVK